MSEETYKLVECQKSWVSARPGTLMSFEEGDVIRVFNSNAKGNWCLGSLFLSDKYPIDDKKMYFPLNYVTEASPERATYLMGARRERDAYYADNSDTDEEANTATEEAESESDSDSDSDNEKETESSQDSQGMLMEALKSYAAPKPVILSFELGDIIRNINQKGKWHCGVLIKSSKYPITNKPLYYPPNFFKVAADQTGICVIFDIGLYYNFLLVSHI